MARPLEFGDMIYLRIHPDMKSAVAERAEMEGVSMSDFIRDTVATRLAETSFNNSYRAEAQ